MRLVRIRVCSAARRTKQSCSLSHPARVAGFSFLHGDDSRRYCHASGDDSRPVNLLRGAATKGGGNCGGEHLGVRSERPRSAVTVQRSRRTSASVYTRGSEGSSSASRCARRRRKLKRPLSGSAIGGSRPEAAVGLVTQDQPFAGGNRSQVHVFWRPGQQVTWNSPIFGFLHSLNVWIASGVGAARTRHFISLKNAAASGDSVALPY